MSDRFNELVETLLNTTTEDVEALDISEFRETMIEGLTSMIADGTRLRSHLESLSREIGTDCDEFVLDSEECARVIAKGLEILDNGRIKKLARNWLALCLLRTELKESTKIHYSWIAALAARHKGIGATEMMRQLKSSLRDLNQVQRAVTSEESPSAMPRKLEDNEITIEGDQVAKPLRAGSSERCVVTDENIAEVVTAIIDQVYETPGSVPNRIAREEAHKRLFGATELSPEERHRFWQVESEAVAKRYGELAGELRECRESSIDTVFQVGENTETNMYLVKNEPQLVCRRLKRLEDLRSVDAIKAEIYQLWAFGGCNQHEVATVLRMSVVDVAEHFSWAWDYIEGQDRKADE